MICEVTDKMGGKIKVTFYRREGISGGGRFPGPGLPGGGGAPPPGLPGTEGAGLPEGAGGGGLDPALPPPLGGGGFLTLAGDVAG